MSALLLQLWVAAEVTGVASRMGTARAVVVDEAVEAQRSTTETRTRITGYLHLVAILLQRVVAGADAVVAVVAAVVAHLLARAPVPHPHEEAQDTIDYHSALYFL